MRRSRAPDRSGRWRRGRRGRLGRLMVAATAWLALSLPLQLAAADPALLGASGLPLPRFVSLRSDEANLRSGPGRNYPIDWIYRRSGLPLQVIDEFDTWRRVRDHDGTAGWMHRSVLSGRRSVIVTGTRSLLRRDPNPTAPGRAYLETGVIGDLTDCDGAWCRIEVEGFEGWLARDEIWGADPLE